MKVFFPYETKNREFDGKLLLSSFLLHKGFTIYIGSRKAMRTEALASNNGIYFFKSISTQEIKFYKKLKERGYQLILLHTEGGIHYKNNDANILAAFDINCLTFFDKNYVFGSSIKESIERLTSYRNNHVTGEPRFDLLKPKYHPYFDKDVKELIKKYNNYILINTNFGLANSFVGEEKLLKYYNTEANLPAETTRLLFHKLEFTKKIFHAYVEAIQILAAKFPDINFIIRAHPSESEDKYNEIASNYPNVINTKSGNVAKWILGSKAVIHYDCTTGMEAALAEIPVISYIPDRDESILAWLPVALSYEAMTTESLIDRIEKIISGQVTKNDIAEEIIKIWKTFVHNVEEESSKLIVDDLVDYLKSKNHSETKHQLSEVLKINYHRIRRDLKFYKDSFKKKKSVIKEKFGEISKSEIQEKLSLLNKINGFENNLTVTKLSNDAFKIKRK